MMKMRLVVPSAVTAVFLIICIIILVLIILGHAVDSHHPHGSLTLDELSSISATGLVTDKDRSPSRYDNTVVLHFQKPRRRFHGNHWFHICEHYLSQHMLIRQRIQQADRKLTSNGMLTGNLHTTSSWINDNTRQWSAANHSEGFSVIPIPMSVLQSIKHVKIIIRQHELSAMMTRYAFYLVVLAVYQPGMQSIELFPPVESYRQLMKAGGSHLITGESRPISISSIDDATQSMVSFTSEGPRFGFYALSSTSPSTRIVDYSVDIIHQQHGHHHHHNSSGSTIQHLLAWMMLMLQQLKGGDRHSLDYSPPVKGGTGVLMTDGELLPLTSIHRSTVVKSFRFPSMASRWPLLIPLWMVHRQCGSSSSEERPMVPVTG